MQTGSLCELFFFRSITFELFSQWHICRDIWIRMRQLLSSRMGQSIFVEPLQTGNASLPYKTDIYVIVWNVKQSFFNISKRFSINMMLHGTNQKAPYMHEEALSFVVIASKERRHSLERNLQCVLKSVRGSTINVWDYKRGTWK